MFIRGLSKKKAVLLSVVIFTIAVVCIMILILIKNDTSTSLSEAYNIAYNEASKWSDYLELETITSVDESGSTPDDGKNGKRQCWNMIFADSTSYDKKFIVSLYYKTPKVHPIISQVDRTQFIHMDQLKLTSEKAVSMAITDYGLLPGQNWARGYHFTVYSFENQMDFEVVGLGANHKMMRIVFDGAGNYLTTIKPHG